MSLAPGTRLGPYEVTAPLGEGGMGVVYRARDTKLNRDVALKVLLPAVAGDPERLARFRREAQVLASLNHPHIGGIHGLEESDGTIALVMELVAGEDLSQRIARHSTGAHGVPSKVEGRGAIPLDEALPIATQIAEALEAAHEQGIVHRDLKPANIKVRPDGTVKVLDFGLAKAMDPASPASSDTMQAATITTPAMTQAGMILGTAAYMAPEQAKGRAVDKRADIWAFGAVLYEMLSGLRAFEGEDIAEVLSRVLQREPDFDALPAATPPRVRALIARCLVKDPRQRLRDIGDARLVLDGAFDAAPAETAPQRASLPIASSRGTRVAWGMAAAAVLGMAALSVPALRHLRQAPPPEVRTEITTPATDAAMSFALSADGAHIAFVAAGERNAAQLWVRALSTTMAQPLAGTEGAFGPFWSPDGGSLGFFAGGQLKRVDLATGVVRTLAAVEDARGGTWGTDGVILFAPVLSPILRISAAGGDASPVTTLDRQAGHQRPVFLPDGRRFLFWASGTGEAAGVFLASLDGGTPARITASDSAAAYAASGWLLWTRGGTLLAQTLDLDRLTLVGEPVTIADGMVADQFGTATVSTSASGLIAYRPGGDRRPRQLQWFDRSGRPLGAMGPRDATLAQPSLSPDGQRAAVVRTVAGNTDIWLLDSTRETRFTSAPELELWPFWAWDGSTVGFSARQQAGVYTLLRKPASGASGEEALGAEGFGGDWSSDGRLLVYGSYHPKRQLDVLVRSMTNSDAPSLVLGTDFNDVGANFSPDGRWISYQSDQSGQWEVYVRAVTPSGQPEAGGGAPAGQWQVSSGGGTFARWGADGRELFYVGANGSMMAVPITVQGATFDVGAPVALFSMASLGGANVQFDVAPDGRFLINGVVGDAVSPPIVLVQHWAPEARR